MRLLAPVICLLLGVAVTLAETPAETEHDQDFLAPVNLNVSKQYRELLESRLAMTKFDCGRIVTQPSFDGESAVAVYFKPGKNGKRAYYVTFTKAESNLWQNRNAPQRVPIKRIDAELRPQTARLLKLVWLRMLKSARLAEVPAADRKKPAVADGTLVEFAVERAKDTPLYGQLVISPTRSGQNIRALTTLAVTLADYCQSPAPARAAIANDLEIQANRLLATLRAQDDSRRLANESPR